MHRATIIPDLCATCCVVALSVVVEQSPGNGIDA